MALMYDQRSSGGGAAPGHILHIRDGVILQNYGENAVSTAQFGTAFTSAIAALQSGDELVCGPLRADVANVTLNVNDVKIYCNDTILNRSGNYTHLFRVSSNDVYVEGLICDGEGIANTGSGHGIWITGDRVRLHRCECSGTRGSVTTNGDGAALRIDACDDTWVTDYTSYDSGYNALWFRTANRCTVDGAYIIDPNRAIGINALTDIDWIHIKNVYARAVTTGKQALLNSNIENFVNLNELHMENVNLIDGDMISPGVSYNDADGHQMAKFQNTRTIVLNNVHFDHGSNAGAGLVRTMYVQDFESNTPPEELYMNGCSLASTFVCGMKIPRFIAEGCYFGVRNIPNYPQLFYRLRAGYARFDACTFNIHNRNRCFSFSALTHADTDVFEFRRNKFIGDSAAAQYVTMNESTDDNTTIGNYPGTVVFDRTNTLQNTGGGGFFRSDQDVARLVLTTDSNGDMIYDGTLLSSESHPAPGGSPPYFPTVPALENGYRIWNKNWTSGQIKGWFANGGAWEEWT